MKSAHAFPFVLVLLPVLLGADSAPEQPSSDQQSAAADASAAVKWLDAAYAGRQPPEAVRMLAAIARGSQMGPGEGWFGPAQSRFDWAWLAARCGVNAEGGIAAAQFSGRPEWFARLDRNKDGSITADDLDWSDRNPFVQQAAQVNRIFRRLNADGDNRLSLAEVSAFFARAAGGKDYLTADDLQDSLLAGVGGSQGGGDGPAPETLVRGLFAGEIGSLQEGPKVGAVAPDFSLKTHDGRATMRLGDLGGGKPLVLVFGNFTCGPFRAMYPRVDDICQRYREQATFLAVYVREAHPTNGWAMESNVRAGIELPQPATYDERVAVASTCQANLHYSMPLLVDEINDPVGNAYSGMPARLYVIDSAGRVAYKSGRGPFGFRPGEMEQALVMALLEQVPVKTDVAPAPPAQ